MNFLFKKKKQCFILSVDSGGFSSLLPLLLLEKLQEELRMQGSAKSLLELFDFVIAAGSGAITIGGLFSMSNMKGQLRGGKSTLYTAIASMTEHIFDPLEHYFFTRGQDTESTLLVKQRYLQQELAKIFYEGRLFARTSPTILFPILDAVLCRPYMLSSSIHYNLFLYDALVLANTYNRTNQISKDEVVSLKNSRQESNKSSNFSSCTTAIPKHCSHIALLARNPSLLAYQYLEKKSENTQFHILSLGTGLFPQMYPIFDVEQHLLYTSVLSQESVIEQSMSLLPNVQYYRVNGAIAGNTQYTTHYDNTNSSVDMVAIFKETHPLEKKEHIRTLFEKTAYAITHKAIPILRKFVTQIV